MSETGKISPSDFSIGQQVTDKYNKTGIITEIRDDTCEVCFIGDSYCWYCLHELTINQQQ